MAEVQNNNAGFALPAPAGGSGYGAPASGTESTAAATVTVQDAALVDTSARDLLIWGGVLLVLFVAFFFVKNGYANSLVAKRIAPSRANAAGWWLFVFLACVSSTVVLGIVNAALYLTPLVAGPLAVVALVALVLMQIAARR